MQRNHIIVLGSLAVVAGLAWYQKKSAGDQAKSVTALGQKSSNNIASSILGTLAQVASSNSAKAQAAAVVDSRPIVAAPAPAAAPFTQPVLAVGPAPAQRKLTAQEINDNVNRIGVADRDSVQKLSLWGRENGVSIADLSSATGYLQNDVANVFSSKGILYGY